MGEREDKKEPSVGEVVEALRAYMLVHPQLRVGQLISNLSVGSVYYISDEELVTALREATS